MKQKQKKGGTETFAILPVRATTTTTTTKGMLDARAFEEKVEEFRLFSNKVLKLMCHEVEGLRDRDTVQVASTSTLAELQAVAAQHKASLCREVEAALRKGT